IAAKPVSAQVFSINAVFFRKICKKKSEKALKNTFSSNFAPSYMDILFPKQSQTYCKLSNQ
ncbi:MAG: hypothetical protein KA168_05530, partial [Chitinophagales bacterium]|nr:hypothetical protein [Chitinophagales bacterium]